MYTKENAGAMTLEQIEELVDFNNQPTTVGEVFAPKYPDSFTSEWEQKHQEMIDNEIDDMIMEKHEKDDEIGRDNYLDR